MIFHETGLRHISETAYNIIFVNKKVHGNNSKKRIKEKNWLEQLWLSYYKKKWLTEFLLIMNIKYDDYIVFLINNKYKNIY